jgi:hypothetical protein
MSADDTAPANSDVDDALVEALGFEPVDGLSSTTSEAKDATSTRGSRSSSDKSASSGKATPSGRAGQSAKAKSASSKSGSRAANKAGSGQGGRQSGAEAGASTGSRSKRRRKSNNRAGSARSTAGGSRDSSTSNKRQTASSRAHSTDSNVADAEGDTSSTQGQSAATKQGDGRTKQRGHDKSGRSTNRQSSDGGDATVDNNGKNGQAAEIDTDASASDSGSGGTKADLKSAARPVVSSSSDSPFSATIEQQIAEAKERLRLRRSDAEDGEEYTSPFRGDDDADRPTDADTKFFGDKPDRPADSDTDRASSTSAGTNGHGSKASKKVVVGGAPDSDDSISDDTSGSNDETDDSAERNGSESDDPRDKTHVDPLDEPTDEADVEAAGAPESDADADEPARSAAVTGTLDPDDFPDKAADSTLDAARASTSDLKGKVDRFAGRTGKAIRDRAGSRRGADGKMRPGAEAEADLAALADDDLANAKVGTVEGRSPSLVPEVVAEADEAELEAIRREVDLRERRNRELAASGDTRFGGLFPVAAGRRPARCGAWCATSTRGRC